MTTSIETFNLTKRYPSQSKEDFSALDNYNLHVEAGQLYGVVGPDGAGKTTLLRILSTVLNPTSGSAQVAGFDVLKQSEQVRSRIGYMPQAFSLYPDLSVLENLRFFADMNGVPREKQKQRIPELLEFARLTEFASRRSENLSGGMRKKLALACAMIHEPEILLLNVIFTVKTLEYLHKGGRIGGGTAFLGSALDIKPILYISNGRIEPLEKQRTRNRSLSRLLELMKEKVGDQPVHVAILHGNIPEEAQQFEHSIRAQFNCVELITSDMGPVIGVHAGPGTLGLVFYTAD